MAYFNGIENKPYIVLDKFLCLDYLKKIKAKCLEQIPITNKKPAISTWPGIKTNILGKSIVIKQPENYEDISFSNKCIFTKESQTFLCFLKPWLDSLPFSEYGRVIFFITSSNRETAAHRDLVSKKYMKSKNEFIYFPITKKKFYILKTENKKAYPIGDAFWFNSTDYHGVESDTYEQISLRVDGIFEDSFRRDILKELDNGS